MENGSAESPDAQAPQRLKTIATRQAIPNSDTGEHQALRLLMAIIERGGEMSFVVPPDELARCPRKAVLQELEDGSYQVTVVPRTE